MTLRPLLRNWIPAGGSKVSKAMGYKSDLKEITERLNVGLDSKVMQVLPLLDDGESSNKNTLYIQFLTTNRFKLRKILETIEEKVELEVPSSSHADKPRHEQTFLKKTDPPKFDGIRSHIQTLGGNGKPMSVKLISVLLSQS
jgi:hypothetical protein